LKTLILVRHAKSSWSDRTLPDIERPLNERGKRAARQLGRRLAERAVCPALIVSSPAQRALRTARLLARRLGYSRENIVIETRLYTHPVSALLRVVQALNDKHARVMLIGHNPQLTELAGRFCARIARMPTCAAATLTFDVGSWADVKRQSLAHMEFDCPKRKRR
jgi:phosphohistidine phosphatase